MSNTNQHERISMYDISRLDYVCRNIIGMCEVIYEPIAKERIPLVRSALAEYMAEINSRYLELVKELEKHE